MDNVSNSNSNRSGPTPLDGGAGEPARPTEAPAPAPPNVSRAPLNLGGAVSAPAAPVAPKPAIPRPAPAKPTAGSAAGERITGCKTFFTKMHPGAIHFLDEQIAKWLAENPQVVIKRTNVIQGEITEKKIEQNIVIVIWY
jgi:hypothetical protein